MALLSRGAPIRRRTECFGHFVNMNARLAHVRKYMQLGINGILILRCNLFVINIWRKKEFPN